MGYIEELRKIVGHRPLILAGANVVIVNTDDRILLQRRADGSWGLPGGLMELGESLEDAARREALEETGLVVGELTLVGIFSGERYYFKVVHNGDELYSVTAVYVTRDVTGEINGDNEETLELRYFHPGEMPEDMDDEYLDYIQAYLSAESRDPKSTTPSMTSLASRNAGVGGYIENLRVIVGHRPLILVGSVVVIVDERGRVLLQRRKEPYGAWGLPGGLMELGESAEETAGREIWEKTGLVVGELMLIGVLSGQGYFIRSGNGDEFYFVTIAYECREISGELRVNDEESLGFQFFEIACLPEGIVRSHGEVLERYMHQ